jgi:tryptophan-rich sensory protein
MRPSTLALLVCLIAVALEGAFAGNRVRERFDELRTPSHSPTLKIWIVIGTLYYALCFQLLRFLFGVERFAPPHFAAFSILIGMMLFNAGWNYLFFRRRSLRGSFLAMLPYACSVLALAAILSRIYPFGAGLLLLYFAYLCYAVLWCYQLWRLNPRNSG